jgi:2-keto-3-deoxy-L-rhamnonate aldolase RhmA
MGALGIVMPHVDSAAEAHEVVDRLKYPPVGHRSMGGIGPHYWLRAVSTGEAAQALNGANLTVVMLETPTAIANAAEIGARQGLDDRGGVQTRRLAQRLVDAGLTAGSGRAE